MMKEDDTLKELTGTVHYHLLSGASKHVSFVNILFSMLNAKING